MRRAHGFDEKLSIVEGPSPPQDDPADTLSGPEHGRCSMVRMCDLP